MAAKKKTTTKTVFDGSETINNRSYNFTNLRRSSKDRVLGGVCAGLAEFFDIDTTLVRLIFILLLIFGGSGVFLYFILWVVLPSDKSHAGMSEAGIKMNAEEIKQRANSFAGYFENQSKQQNSKKLFGLIVLALGVMFLHQNFGMFRFEWIGKLWPLILIALAFSILTNSRGAK